MDQNSEFLFAVIPTICISEVLQETYLLTSKFLHPSSWCSHVAIGFKTFFIIDVQTWECLDCDWSWDVHVPFRGFDRGVSLSECIYTRSLHYFQSYGYCSFSLPTQLIQHSSRTKPSWYSGEESLGATGDNVKKFCSALSFHERTHLLSLINRKWFRKTTSDDN